MNSDPATSILHPTWRAVLSVLFIVHLTAIFVAPMTSSIITAVGNLPAEAQPEHPPTPWVYDLLQPYLDVAYLNHGYGFFAPDPGPSHLIRYTIEFAHGRQQQGVFPDLDVHWPRLRYHRHFMLAEQVVPNAGEAYARHLLTKYAAKRVTVDRVRHFLARPEEILAGMKLDTPETYESLGEITVRADEDPKDAAP